MVQAVANMKASDPYLARFEDTFEREGAARGPAWLYPIRKAGISRFAEIGLPTQQHEDWRFTNVGPIGRLPFKPLLEPAETNIKLEQFNFTGLPSSRLVFVNGHYSARLSSIIPQEAGIHIGSLAVALSNDGALLQKYLGRFAKGDENGFAALNTAFFTDGAFIYVPAGKAVREAVHLLFVSTAAEAGAAIHPRNLVVESYVSTVQSAYVTNTIDELVVGDNAVVEHCKFQEESRTAYHVAAQHLHIGRGANVISHSFAFGGKLSRNNIRTTLAGEGLDCILNGLYIMRDEQLADHHMIVEHATPRCNSHEYYNGILDDRSRGVFHGRILVQQAAQKTDAKQTNKNLLLSDDATANTKPQLEIYADDVKCTHGATVGQLNDESIFYLRARGIGAETARRILIHAFAGEIIDRVRCEPLREELDRLVWDRLEDNPHL
jgi:Fe-S cluster assembly protein SufD